ncbi:MAG: DUF2807 domain-containing protein [Anaerolineales bacterium]|nr:DUF2807 domain-containing protein [Anaerolineales bacterium]
MKTRIHLPIIVLIAALLLTGCGFSVIAGNRDIVTENRQVSNFSNITLAGIGEVIITQGETETLVIEAESNLIDYFETEVRGGTLTIGLKDEYRTLSLNPTRPVRFYVTVIELEGVTVAGSGDIDISAIEAAYFALSILGSGSVDLDSLETGRLTVNLSGSGDARIDVLAADEISTTITGAGSFSAAGQARQQEIRILGSGDYNAADLFCQVASVNVSGSGQTNLWVDETLDVTILGNGDINYAGDARLGVSSTGSGEVNRTDRH